MEFPFDLFTAPLEDCFLRFVFHNFMRAAILQITKLTTDNGKDTYTLRKFKNFMADSVKVELQDEYRKALKNVRFTSRIENLLRAARLLRDKQIAHSIQQVDGLSFGQAGEIADELTKLFNVAAFDVDYAFLLIPYDRQVRHPSGTDSRPDIERMLDSIAKESVVLHMPEEGSYCWQYFSRGWGPDLVEKFNGYRRKFGLPEV